MNLRKYKLRKARKRMRIRSRLKGTEEKPRLVIRKTNRYLYAQIVDDVSHKVLLSGTSLTKAVAAKGGSSKNLETAKKLGETLAASALEKGIAQVVFDRNIHIYHGKIKALADGAREKGLKF